MAQAPQPPFSDTPMDIAVGAVVNNPDGSVFYQQSQLFTNCDRKMQEALYGALEKQANFLDDLNEQQKKDPAAIFSAVLTCTGMPDLNYVGFDYNTFQKAFNGWHKMGEELLKLGEKRIKGKS